MSEETKTFDPKNDEFSTTIPKTKEVPEQEQPEKVAPKEQPEPKPKEKKSNVVVWQFRHRNYQLITNIIDENSAVLQSGGQSYFKIMARNWRIPLDLSIERDLEKHEYLKKSPQCGADFWIIDDAKDGKSNEKAKTLKELLRMSEMQLRTMITTDELIKQGYTGALDTIDLAMAILDSGKVFKGKG